MKKKKELIKIIRKYKRINANKIKIIKVKVAAKQVNQI